MLLFFRMEENKQDHWFKARRYGWGWYPAAREGWIVTAMFIIATFLVVRMNIDTPDMIPIHVGILVLALAVVAWRTGERPSWSWSRGSHECRACGLRYDDLFTAKACERWCTDTNSCNIDIIKEAIENRIDNVKDS